MSEKANKVVVDFRSRLISLDRFAKVGLMMTADLILLPLCFIAGILLQGGGLDVTARYGFAPYLLIPAITIPFFSVTGFYNAVIRFIDQRILIAAGVSLAIVVLSVSILSSLFAYPSPPGDALVLCWLIAFTYVLVSRLVARTFLRSASRRGLEGSPLVAIYGAGEAGVKLSLAMRVSNKYRPVCFFDDKASLDNRNVAGLTVFNAARLNEIVAQKNIGLIVIAIPSASREQRAEALRKARRAGVPVKILYSLMELGDKEISAQSIREIKIDDLLGREPIQPRLNLFSRCVRGQNVLVTGAGGSIGSELCRQIMTQGPAILHLLEHSEYALYKIEQELCERFPGIQVRAHLGNVCSVELVERIMDECRIDTVYHAAAYKHVPLVESNMAEGVRNNVLGAQVVANAAAKFGVKTCVLVSTDKAVRPTSIMGASKRIAELIFQAASTEAKSDTKFCMVRFGNVLGSSGSVVPLFKSQIERGGPITITHPDVVRYFMSIPEAAQLVVQAGAMAKGGDVFVMDMGEQVKIVDLARTMIAMSGLTEKNEDNACGDIEIQFVGLRPGEKLYEELFAGDTAIPSDHPRIMTTTEYQIESDVLAQELDKLMAACANNDLAVIRFVIQKLVRGYSSQRIEEPVQHSPETPRYQLSSVLQNEELATDG